QPDDARALENWQRLAPDRLPAGLAAPFRWALDPAFRAAQPAAAQAALQARFDRLQGSPLLARLRGLRAALADKESLAPAFGQADRARALVWLHMGRNAAALPGPEKLAKLPSFLREELGRPRPLSPSAEKCFERSIELTPDRLDAYEALFRLHLDAGRDAPAA